MTYSTEFHSVNDCLYQRGQLPFFSFEKLNVLMQINLILCLAKGKQATIVVRVGNNRPDLGVNPICNR